MARPRTARNGILILVGGGFSRRLRASTATRHHPTRHAHGAAPPLAGPTPIPAQDAATHASTRPHTHVPAAVPVTDRDTEQDRVDAHVERCLRQLGFSACESQGLNGAGADHHYAEHLVRDLGYSVDRTYELLRP